VSGFGGFSRDFIRFFEELAANNDRDWFNDNKSRYLDTVVGPISEFIVEMAPRLKKISKHFTADPRPHGGSMFRIYRDTRFSKDKTPYKTHAGVQFRHSAGRDAHGPGFYVHLAPDEVFSGGGIWHPPNPVLNSIRDSMADNVRAWARIANAKKTREVGGIRGEQLKRPPRGFDAEHIHIEDLKRKSLYIMTESDPNTMLGPEFVDRVTESFRRAAPLNRFVCDALELPF
jgi:uncharacterized protein (TIGR02453 family)